LIASSNWVACSTAQLGELARSRDRRQRILPRQIHDLRPVLLDREVHETQHQRVAESG
jgi:hypothetical protein